MKLEKVNKARRQFVRSGVAVAFTAPALISLPKLASAAELPKLDPNNTQAKALQYVHDASTVDAGKRGGADKICASCRFYTEPDGSAWGPCTLFPGKSVSAKGWCASWIAKS